MVFDRYLPMGSKRSVKRIEFTELGIVASDISCMVSTRVAYILVKVQLHMKLEVQYYLLESDCLLS